MCQKLSDSVWLECLLLNFPEDLLPVEQEGDEDPAGSGEEILGEVLAVGLAVGHAPTEGEVIREHFVAHIDQDGVHAGVVEGSP